MRSAVFYSVFLAALVLAGCAAPIKDISGKERVSLREDESIVFGRVAITAGGKPVPFSVWNGPEPYLGLMNMITGKNSLPIVFREDGRFQVVMPRGAYLVTAVALRDYPYAAFRVPGERKAVYIGTLVLAAKSAPVTGYDFLPRRGKVVDDFEDARRAFVESHPEYAGNVEKRLMVHDLTLAKVPGLVSRSRGRVTPEEVLGTMSDVFRSGAVPFNVGPAPR